jgi:RNA polymerase sigma-70 factor (ECF subfamily)
MADAAAVALVQLVHDHHQALYRYAYRLCGSVPDAEDLTQQVYLVAQQKLGQLRDAASARSWLFTILRNCYLKTARKRLALPIADFDVSVVPQPVAAGPLDSEDLQRAIDSLGDEFKIVVLMFYFEHYSYREIAELLDLPPGTVMSRLARAKGHLRRLLGGAQQVHEHGRESVLKPEATFPPHTIKH